MGTGRRGLDEAGRAREGQQAEGRRVRRHYVVVAHVWTAFAVQKVSCALVRAVAWEVARALDMPTTGDPRRAERGG